MTKILDYRKKMDVTLTNKESEHLEQESKDDHRRDYLTNGARTGYMQPNS
jgi:hypothetical protein